MIFLPDYFWSIVLWTVVLTFSAFAVFIGFFMYQGSWRLRLLLVLPLLFSLFFMIVPAVISQQHFSFRAHFDEALEKARQKSEILKPDDFTQAQLRNPDDNAVLYYEKTRKLFDSPPASKIIEYYYTENKNPDLSAWTELERKDAMRLINAPEIKTIINLFAEGASKKQGIYPRDLKRLKLPGDEDIYPRDLDRLLSCTASAMCLSGRTDEASALILSLLDVPAQFEKDPSFVMQLSLFRLVSNTCAAASALAVSPDLSEQKKLAMIDALSDLKNRKSLIYAFDFERSFVVNAFASGINSEAFLALWKEFFKDTKGSFPLRMAYSMLYTMDGAAYLDYSSKIRNLFLRPYWEIEKESEALRASMRAEQPFCLLSKILLPAVIPVIRKTAGLESEIEVSKLNLALNVYKKRNGSYPAKLSLLSPSILKEILPDPLTGKPFMYSKTGDSYKLSCVWLEEKKKTASSAAPSASR